MPAPHSHRPLMIPFFLAGGALALFLWLDAVTPAEDAQGRIGTRTSQSLGSSEGPRQRSSAEYRTGGLSLAGTLSLLFDPPGSENPEPPTAASTIVRAQTTSIGQAALRRSIAEFEAGKENAFFSPREAARKLLRPEARGESVRGLRELMRDTSAIKELPRNVRYLTQQPPAVTARMAALDLFFAMVDEDQELIAELVALVAEPLEVNLDEHVARVVMAEKYESLAKLGSLDFAIALKTFQNLADPQIQAILRPALIEGLASTGISYTEAEAVVDGATLPA